MKEVVRLIQNYPARSLALVEAVLAMLVAFNVPITVEQMAGIVAVFAVVLGTAVHSGVTPNVRVSETIAEKIEREEN